MLRVRDLRALAAFPVEALRREIGPWALIQHPPPAVMQQVALKVAGARTVTMANKDRLAEQIMKATLSFDTMLVLTPLSKPGKSELVLGRQPDCDFLVADPSVSSRHARLTWDGRHVVIKDNQSTNGTFVNARNIDQREVRLGDGDSVLLGDAAFIFVSVESLHAALAAPA